MITLLKIWMIKKLAGNMGIVLNLNAVSFQQQYPGQPVYGDNVDFKLKSTPNLKLNE